MVSDDQNNQATSNLRLQGHNEKEGLEHSYSGAGDSVSSSLIMSSNPFIESYIGSHHQEVAAVVGKDQEMKENCDA